MSTCSAGARDQAQRVAVNRQCIQPGRLWHLSGVCAIAAPWPLAGITHHACAHRIEIDIPTDFKHVGVLVYQNALEASLWIAPGNLILKGRAMELSAIGS